jgi:hypothetical protein
MFPDGIILKSREGWDYPKKDKQHNILRTLTGQGPYLQQHSIASGMVPLSNSTAHWWILKEEQSLLSNNGYIEATGHIAALYQNELYELATGRHGMSRLQQFGITFGHKLVVIYIEPSSKLQLTTNTARTNLLINNDHLPWTEWATEFRNNLPEEITLLIEEKAAAAINTDHNKAIRERLKDIITLYNLSRYKPVEEGSHLVDDENVVNVGSFKHIAVKERQSMKEEGTAGTGGNVYAVFEKAEGTPAKKIIPDPFPEVRWISIRNNTREPGDMEDRAAKFLVDTNLLLINEDFPGYSDIVHYLIKDHKDIAGIEAITLDATKGWFEQALVETIIGVQSLVNRKDWTQVDIDKALSEEALTAAVMQRYHLLIAVKRDLGSKLGSLK